MPTVENASPADDSTPAESTGIASQDWATASASPQYRAAVVDLLGALAYGELAAFERLAEDAKLAPTLDDKAELAAMASAEFHHFEQLRDRLAKIEAERVPLLNNSSSPKKSCDTKCASVCSCFPWRRTTFTWPR